jgi:predicted nucleic acid-binding protein
VTAAYLLALAARHDGRLVTFDRSIPLAAVQGAREANLTVL